MKVEKGTFIAQIPMMQNGREIAKNAWVRTLGLIFWTLIFGVGRPGFASDATSVPLPRRRPPQQSDIQRDSQIVPAPLNQSGAVDNPDAAGDTSADLQARQQADAAAKAQAQARADAEAAATAAEKAATLAQISANDMSAAAGSWEKKAAAALANQKIAQGQATSAQQALDAWTARMNAQSSITDRAQIAELKAANLKAQMNATSYSYIYADSNTRALSARATAAQQQTLAKQAAIDAILARVKANLFIPGFQADPNPEKNARADLANAQAAYNTAVQNSIAAQGAAKTASDSYYQLKPAVDAAVKFSASAVGLAKAKVSADAQVQQIQGRIQTADQATATLQRQAQALPGADGLALAQARVGITQSMAAAALLRIQGIDLMKAASQATTAAEAVIAPLTPNFAQALQSAAGNFTARNNDAIATAKAFIDRATKLNAMAQARLALVKKATDLATSSSRQLAWTAPATLKLGQALENERTIRTAIASLKPGVSSDVDVASARSNLAKALAQSASARSALADLEKSAADAALALNTALVQTEPELLQILPSSTPDASSQLTASDDRKTGAADQKKTAAATAAALATKAQSRADIISGKYRNFAKAQGLRQTGEQSAQTQSSALGQARTDAKTATAASADAVTLANARAAIGLAQLAWQKAQTGLVQLQVSEAQARLDAAEAFAATEDVVQALVPWKVADPRPALRQALATAQQKVQNSNSDLQKAQAVSEAATAQAATIKKLAKVLQGARDALKTASSAVAPAQKSANTEKAKYDQRMSAGGDPDDLANDRVPWDRAKLALAQAQAAVDKAQALVAQALLNLDTAMVKTDVSIIQLYAFAWPDQLAKESQDLANANAVATASAAAAKQAEDAVINSRVAVLDIQNEMQNSADLANQARVAQAAAALSKKKVDAAEQANAGAHRSMIEQIKDVALRVLPSSLTGDQQAQARLQNSIDEATARLKEADVFLLTERAEVKAATDSWTAAKAAQAAAKSLYQMQSTRRDGLTSRELGLAAADLDLQNSAVVTGEIHVREANRDLLKAIGEFEDQAGALTEMLQQIDSGDARMVDLNKRVQNLEKERAAIAGTLTDLDVRARQQALDRADQLADHSAALQDGKMPKLISLEALANKLAIKYDGHHCDSNDTDPIKCMACNNYWEAGNDPSFEGKLLPGRIVMERLEKGLGKRWGHSPCEIIYKWNWVKSKKTGSLIKAYDFSWAGESDTETNGNHTFKAAYRTYVLAALIAYYETDVPYSYDMYWNERIVHEPFAQDCTPKRDTVGLHSVCRTADVVDPKMYREDALTRAKESGVDESTLDQTVGDLKAIVKKSQ